MVMISGTSKESNVSLETGFLSSDLSSEWSSSGGVTYEDIGRSGSLYLSRTEGTSLYSSPVALDASYPKPWGRFSWSLVSIACRVCFAQPLSLGNPLSGCVICTEPFDAGSVLFESVAEAPANTAVVAAATIRVHASLPALGRLASTGGPGSADL